MENEEQYTKFKGAIQAYQEGLRAYEHRLEVNDHMEKECGGRWYFYKSLHEFNLEYNTDAPFETWDEVAENYMIARVHGYDAAFVLQED